MLLPSALFYMGVDIRLVCAMRGFRVLHIFVSIGERNLAFLPPIENKNSLYRGKSVHLFLLFLKDNLSHQTMNLWVSREI